MEKIFDIDNFRTGFFALIIILMFGSLIGLVIYSFVTELLMVKPFETLITLAAITIFILICFVLGHILNKKLND